VNTLNCNMDFFVMAWEKFKLTKVHSLTTGQYYDPRPTVQFTVDFQFENTTKYTNKIQYRLLLWKNTKKHVDVSSRNYMAYMSILFFCSNCWTRFSYLLPVPPPLHQMVCGLLCCSIHEACSCCALQRSWWNTERPKLQALMAFLHTT